MFIVLLNVDKFLIQIIIIVFFFIFSSVNSLHFFLRNQYSCQTFIKLYETKTNASL